jgi:hypothetical protein
MGKFCRQVFVLATRFSQMCSAFCFAYVASVIVCPLQASAQADSFADRCTKLTRDASVTVEFEDREVATDETQSVQALTARSGKAAGGPNQVYGLTHAKPTVHLNVVVRTISDGSGRTCAMPDIALTLGFSEFVVYLASELTDPCRREVIRAHEQEHVNTWKSHLRASANMLPGLLRRDLCEARRSGRRACAGQRVGVAMAGEAHCGCR